MRSLLIQNLGTCAVRIFSSLDRVCACSFNLISYLHTHNSSLAAGKADVYQQISADQVRQLLKERPKNMVTLVQKLVNHLSKFAASKGSLIEAEQQQCISCANLLTRIIPFIFETRGDTFADDLFWKNLIRGEDAPEPQNGHTSAPSPQQHPLAQELMDAILVLLFKPGFTCWMGEGGSSYWEGGHNGCMGPENVPKSRHANVGPVSQACHT
jgi:hypothetical protein